MRHKHIGIAFDVGQRKKEKNNNSTCDLAADFLTLLMNYTVQEKS